MKRFVFALVALFILQVNSALAVLDRAVPTSGPLSAVLTDLNSELAENYKLTPMLLENVTGTNDYTANVTPTLLSMQDGMSFWIKPPNTNTGNVRVNVDGLGLVQVTTAGGAALGSGDFQSTTLYLMRYLQSSNQLRLVTPAGTGFASADALFLVLSASAPLTAERVATAGTCISITDAGANSTATFAVIADCIGPTQIDETANYDWTGIHTFDSDGVQIDDTDASAQLVITPGSNLTADRVLTLTTGDSARTVTISGNTTISQDNSTTGNPQFATIELGAATDTTLSRPAAGRLQVEGVDVFSVAGTGLTSTNQTVNVIAGTCITSNANDVAVT